MDMRASLWERRAPFTHSLASKSLSENLEKSISSFQPLPIFLSPHRDRDQLERAEYLRHEPGDPRVVGHSSRAMETLHLVAPGDVITTDTGFMRYVHIHYRVHTSTNGRCLARRGHGTYHSDDGKLVASVAGVVQRINRLISVRPLQSRLDYYPIVIMCELSVVHNRCTGALCHDMEIDSIQHTRDAACLTCVSLLACARCIVNLTLRSGRSQVCRGGG